MTLTRSENAAYVVERIRALGFEPHPMSRLMVLKRVLERGFVPYDDPEFPVALESIRDLQHIGFALARMDEHTENPKFKELVKRLLRDSVLPQSDREESPGRDAQLELYLAAICQNAGLLPVDYDEPDITCVAEGISSALPPND